MAINTNIERMNGGGGRVDLTRSPVERVEVKQPAPTPTTTPAHPPAQPMMSTTPNILATSTIRPIPQVLFTPPILPSIPFFTPQKTTTQIAQGAISLLSGANQAVVQEAVNTAKNRNVAAGSLMNYLERKVKIGEVLSELAAQWSVETRQDFAEAFQMPQDKPDVMDAIVSIAILNDPDLSDELLVENMPDATEGDLLENRRIVWQYPPPGTVLQPPFLVLLAVEHRDTKRAEDVIQSIVGSLVDYQGYKLPRAAVQKLTGRPIVTAVSPALNIAALNIRPTI
jgi:hypothetical protein